MVPGGMELGVILLIVLIIFGPGKLPQLGRSIGTAITEFKEGIKGVQSTNDNPTPPATTDAQKREAAPPQKDQETTPTN